MTLQEVVVLYVCMDTVSFLQGANKPRPDLGEEKNRNVKGHRVKLSRQNTENKCLGMCTSTPF